MDIRSRMIEFRNERQISLSTMAKKCDISETLLSIVESGGVTVPGIAKRIGECYELSELDIEELMPICRRPHSEFYVEREDIPGFPQLPRRINKYCCYECTKREEGCHETCDKYFKASQYNAELREAEYKAKRIR